MIITLKTKDFKQALLKLSYFKQSELDQLVATTTKNNKIEITIMTSNFNYVKTKIDGTIEQQGRAVFELNNVLAILKNIKQKEITINGNKIDKIQLGSGSFKQLYNQIDTIKFAIAIDSDLLLRSIEAVQNCASKKKSDTSLYGIILNSNNGETTIGASNRLIMSLAEFKQEGSLSNVVIESKYINCLKKLLTNGAVKFFNVINEENEEQDIIIIQQDDWEMAINVNKSRYSLSNVYFRTRAFNLRQKANEEIHYRDYISATFNRKQFMEALETIISLKICDNETNLNLHDGTILAGNKEEGCFFEDKLTLKNNENKLLTKENLTDEKHFSNFNAKYMISQLKNLKNDEVVLNYIADSSIFFLEEEQKDFILKNLISSKLSSKSK